MPRGPKPRPEAERFWEKVDKSGDCWLWTAAMSADGYGQFHSTYSNLAHRFAYWLVNGPVPEGMEIDHTCRTRHCVNPVHLEAVPHIVNMHRTPTHAPRTHCQRGHELTPENTLVSRPGHRKCKACDAIRARRRYLDRRAA